MKLNEFELDLEYSLNQRESEFLDEFYQRIFPGLLSVEFITDLQQQKRGIDKILHFKSGLSITIDEKKRRTDYGDILLETWSVWEKKIRGWLYTSQCDYIVYAIMPISKAYILPTFLLKKTWLSNQIDWQIQYGQIFAQNKGYITKNIAIPSEILIDAISKEMEQKLE